MPNRTDEPIMVGNDSAQESLQGTGYTVAVMMTTSVYNVVHAYPLSVTSLPSYSLNS